MSEGSEPANGSPFGRKKPAKVLFPLQGLTIALIKAAGIREGCWQVAVVFDTGGHNLKANPMVPIRPAIVTFIHGLELIQVPEANDMALDAAVVNPPSPLVRLTDTVN